MPGQPDLQTGGYSIEAMRLLARSALPRFVFDFADGAAEDEWTLRRNEAAFDDYVFLPKPLNGAGERDLSITLFGHRLSMPLILGPTGLAGLFWPQAEQCIARAAAAAGTAFCLSHGSVCTLEDVAGIGASPRWMQVFIYKDRGFTRELASRAEAAGYDALVLTTDNQVLGKRERDLRNGFSIPPRFGPLDVAGMALKAPWLWRMREELQRINFGNYVRDGEKADIKTLAARMQSLLDQGMNWADVDALRAQWRGPLILKGVLHPDEAREALQHGIDAVIVSNHGGRQLDGAIGSLDALPGVVEAVQGRMPVLVDGGIRRGADMVKALALGATACLEGRPHLWGVAVAGEAGVAHVLETFRREIDRVMGLCGLRSIADIKPSLIRRSSFH
ncbi:alpha-hydroxy-acid oxidizing enzyme [Labrys miyagiensis]|uniref:Alpha-hydroxy-acid oxidizing enzyme n=1 Tax=Labrys miyagiensis TaxID=346912 RepID=A0ABQ6CLJ4_9HYPH|nr:alpha-hydroxy acid oxidase [Labrys miyagiensis]GLS20629.1 alpha-hydroxy-acid oxidizing enzyme [Labrys miyagiensis]